MFSFDEREIQELSNLSDAKCCNISAETPADQSTFVSPSIIAPLLHKQPESECVFPDAPDAKLVITEELGETELLTSTGEQLTRLLET